MPCDPTAPSWPDPTKILTRRELIAVLTDLSRKSKRSPSTRLNLIVFRLAACCGLRASEIARFEVGDVRIDSTRPHLRIRRGAAKGGQPRTVPPWWDAGTLRDIKTWKADRIASGAGSKAPFVSPPHSLRPFSRHTLRKRFRTACRALGKQRLKTLTIHHGRHTFTSHALAGVRSGGEAQDA